MEQVIGGDSADLSAPAIKDTTAIDFAADVLDASQEAPIIVDFGRIIGLSFFANKAALVPASQPPATAAA